MLEPSRCQVVELVFRLPTRSPSRKEAEETTQNSLDTLCGARYAPHASPSTVGSVSSRRSP